MPRSIKPRPLNQREILDNQIGDTVYDPSLTSRSIDNEMFGPDIMQNIKIGLPEVVLNPDNPFNIIVPINITPEIGDIIFDIGRERYYEIHNIIVDYYSIVSNVGITNLNCPPVKILKYDLDCYLTRVSRLNLLPYKLL